MTRTEEGGGGPVRLTKIACATRGGEASRATEAKAIALAQEHGADLVFVYVVDVSFGHGQTGKFGIEMLEEDVRTIGRLVLEQAKLRAKEQGVNARTELREGCVADEILAFVEEHRDLDALVVGHMSEDLRAHLDPVLHHLASHNLRVVVVNPSPHQV